MVSVNERMVDAMLKPYGPFPAFPAIPWTPEQQRKYAEEQRGKLPDAPMVLGIV